MTVLSLSEIAHSLGTKYRGDGDTLIEGVSSLENPKARSLAFITQAKYLASLDDTIVAAAIIKPEWSGLVDIPAILVEDPYLAYAKVSHLFNTRPVPITSIHTAAHIDATAILGEHLSIGPGVVIEAGAKIGNHVVIGANTSVGANTSIGDSTQIAANVSIYHDVFIGAQCDIASGAVIGADGFGFAPSPVGWQAIAQNGGVVIGDKVFIGANTCIDRGAIDPTVIGNAVIIDNLVQIAHNVTVGDNTAFAGCAAVAGSSTIGSNCLIGGSARIIGHLAICDNVQVSSCTRVTKSIKEPGEYASGTPFMKVKDWRKAAAKFSRSIKSKQKKG